MHLPMLLPTPAIPHSVSIQAVRFLSEVDYNVANRVTEQVAGIVTWAYLHNQDGVARWAVHALQHLDQAGSLLISLVVWIIDHS